VEASDGDERLIGVFAILLAAACSEHADLIAVPLELDAQEGVIILDGSTVHPAVPMPPHPMSASMPVVTRGEPRAGRRGRRRIAGR